MAESLLVRTWGVGNLWRAARWNWLQGRRSQALSAISLLPAAIRFSVRHRGWKANAYYVVVDGVEVPVSPDYYQYISEMRIAARRRRRREPNG